MKVSIIIPSYNSRATIARAIEASLAIDHADKELIVVDDGSTDDSPAIASRYDLKLIRQANGGPAKARNAGWKAATGEICFFTDADCFPNPDVLEILLEQFNDKEVAAAGGSYEIANPESMFARLIHAEIILRHSSMPPIVNFLGSFNCAYRRKTLEETGGFNEEYTTPSAEDNDLSYRVHANGGKMAFDARAKVSHMHETSLIRYLRQQYNHGKWRMKLYSEHRNRTGGDSYSGLFDFLQPPLAVLVFFGLPLLSFPPTQKVYISLFALYCIIQIPMPIMATLKTGRMENMLLIPVTFLRGFARGFGLLAGLLKYWL